MMVEGKIEHITESITGVGWWLHIERGYYLYPGRLPTGVRVGQHIRCLVNPDGIIMYYSYPPYPHQTQCGEPISWKEYGF
jgi:hypothetical protein